MNNNDGLITPPPELRKQWINESPNISLDGHTRIGTDWDAVMDKAARWGADSVPAVKAMGMVVVPWDGNRAVVVVDRRALHVFKWESIGFAKMVETAKADLRTIADVDIPEGAEIFCVPVSENWGLQ